MSTAVALDRATNGSGVGARCAARRASSSLATSARNSGASHVATRSDRGGSVRVVDDVVFVSASPSRAA
jgi:hypothetical protein